MRSDGTPVITHCPLHEAAGERFPVTVRPLQEADVKQAVDIHIRAIPYSINSLLGEKHLADIYRTMVRMDGALALVAIDGAGRVVGVVTGLLDPRMILRAMARPVILGPLAVRLLAHPQVIMVSLSAIFGTASRRPRGVRTLLSSIAVADAARGQGVGTRLVAALDAAFTTRGITHYWLETRCSNPAALAFYAKLGFVEFSRTRRDVCFVRAIAKQERLP